MMLAFLPPYPHDKFRNGDATHGQADERCYHRDNDWIHLVVPLRRADPVSAPHR
jgi:hypothetical protein